MRYDTTLKELLQYGTPQLWQALLGEPIQEFLTVELPSVQMRKPDFVARLEGSGLLHVELQSDNDEMMEWRALEYYLLLFRLYQQPPIQYVLYFGSAPLTMQRSINQSFLQFRYTLIDVRSLNAQFLLGSDSLADNALAFLGEGIDRAEVTRTILARISKLSSNEQRDWVARLMILSGLRNAENIVQQEAVKMGISTDIRDNKFYQEAYAAGIEDGIEKGIEKGIAEGETKALRRLLERRFGVLPKATEQRLDNLKRSEIEAAIERVFDAKQIEDVFGERQN